MPAFAVLDFGEAAALPGPGQDNHRLVGGQRAGLGQRLVDGRDVVPVDGKHLGAERLRPAGVRVQVPGQLGRPALAEPVDVDHRDQVAQLVVRRLVQGFPDRALGHLTVPAQHPHPVVHPVQVLAGQRDADRVGQPLAERAGSHVHPGQHRGGMALQRGAEPAVAGHQLLIGDHPGRLEHRVQQRGGVPFGEDQMIVGRVGRLLPVVTQVPGHQHGQQVRGGHAGGRVARPGRGAAPDRVDP